MDETKVNYHKTQIDLMSFEIDLLDEQSKVEVIKHLEETLSLLKIGARDVLSPKRIKLENEANKVPVIDDEDAIRAMYEGLIPTCTDCGAKFPSLGALDNHSKTHDLNNHSKTHDLDKQRKTHEQKIIIKEEVKALSENVGVKTESKSSTQTNITCTECGKQCTSKKNLQRHRMIHSTR